MKELEHKLKESRGCAVIWNNDRYLLGVPEVVHPVLERFTLDIKQRCRLSLEMAETEIYMAMGYRLDGVSLTAQRQEERLVACSGAVSCVTQS